MPPTPPPAGPDADALFARWRRGRDPAALGALFDAAAPGLFRLALSLTPDAAAAEDALQETFLLAMEEAERHDPARPVLPWLAGILRLKVLEERRRNARAPRPERVVPPDPVEAPELAAMDAEERARLHEAMRRLPEPYRGVALLRWRYGLEPSEIAEVRGVPPGTVWSWLHRALARLKLSMGALPALLLAFRPERGIEGVRDALLRRAASEAAAEAAATTGAGASAALVTGGVAMSAKVAMVAGGVVVAASCVWLLGRPDAESGAPGTPPAVDSPAVPPSAPPPAERPSAPPPPDAPPSGVAPFDPSLATATILVRATLKGEAPKMRPVKMDQDAECMKLHAEPVLEETVVCQDGKLANVIAFVSKGAEKWSFRTPTEPAVMDQRGCVYVPHVFTVMVNQPITIKNSDPTMHNVHATKGANEDWNKAMLKGAKDLTHSFAKPEVPAKFKCDVHGWMSAKVGVFTHPFHGTTGADGTVAIRVPPGEYEIESWHEYDKLQKPAPKKVVVAAGSTSEIEFDYSMDRR